MSVGARWSFCNLISISSVPINFRVQPDLFVVELSLCCYTVSRPCRYSGRLDLPLFFWLIILLLLQLTFFSVFNNIQFTIPFFDCIYKILCTFSIRFTDPQRHFCFQDHTRNLKYKCFRPLPVANACWTLLLYCS